MKHAAQRKHISATVRSALLVQILGVAAIGTSSSVFAQQADPKASEAAPAAQKASEPAPAGQKAKSPDVVSIEKVIVTAQKREQDLQDVPIAVTAFSEKELLKLGADGFSDYANFVPGLSFQNRGPGQNRFAIRGVSAPVSTSASTVGIYIDDLAVSELLNTPDLSLFDVHSVEVLRGPQGTLYGEGSMGGTIKIITNRPNSTKFESAFQAGYGNINHGGNAYDVSAMINAPVSDNVAAVRLVAYTRNNDGWIDNVVGGVRTPDVNSTKTDGARLGFRVQPSANFDAQLTGIYQKQRLGGFNEESITMDRGEQSHSNPEGRKDEFTIGNLVMNYKMPTTTLTSATAWMNREFIEDRDIGTFGFLPKSAAQNTKTKFKTFTEELRLASNGGGNWNWVTGFYYKDYKSTENDAINNPIFGAPTTIETKVKQNALFGDITYRLSPTTDLAIGARYSKDEQSVSYRSTVRILPSATSDSNGCWSCGEKFEDPARWNYNLVF